MNNNIQSRKWLLTICNSTEKNISHDQIKFLIESMKSIINYFISEESENTSLVHVYILSKSPIRLSTIKSRFPYAFIEKGNGRNIKESNPLVLPADSVSVSNNQRTLKNQ